ncbi:HEAT repeat domain-containing protein [Limnobaculum parvum]|uniref:HEAT repeat domain-containing protein n=1 Tax=Limnobaculum parvum TaxID=2172103 RepID=A0A2Y9TXY4_9GAMM|nr:HEAT repeat domain-containing protein [Limnobaculum parvum]AWH88608.1 HEAT repeat domain-containing protein [Limnobaculum parvum]
MNSRTNDDILAALEKERLEKEALTEDEMTARYNTLLAGNSSKIDMLNYATDLGRSKLLDYHFSLLCQQWDNLPIEYRALYNSFYRHDLDGIDFLFEKIADSSLEKYHCRITHLIASCLTKFTHRDFYPDRCKKLNPYLIQFIDIKDNEQRRDIIIALGWVGTASDIELLCHHMKNDGDSLCRAWSASSLMQLSFHGVTITNIVSRSRVDFISAIDTETDLFALGCMIESAQILWKKKWVSATNVEKRDAEKILKAQASAIRFLSKP